jgi:hypothetical protein
MEASSKIVEAYRLRLIIIISVLRVRDECPKLDEQKRMKFHSFAQRCLYLCKQVRRDIAVAVAFLTTRVRQPDNDDWSKLVPLIKYINGTKGQELRLGDGTQHVVINLTASIDASFAAHSDGRSHSSSTITMGGGSDQWSVMTKRRENLTSCECSTTR